MLLLTKRAPAVLLVAIASLSGCFNPDDIFPVHGSITSPDSVSGQSVRLLRDSSIEAAQLPTCSEAKPFKETTTDEAGNFSFDVFRAQAQKLTGFGQFCFRVETTFPSGTTAFSDVRIDSELTLPPFPDWRAQPSRVDGVLHFEPLAPLQAEESFEGDQLSHRAEWVTGDGGLAWVVDDHFFASDGSAPVRQPMGFEDVVLEDFSGSVRLTARLTKVTSGVGPFGGGSSTIEVRSGQTLALTGTRPPISRGLPCPPLETPCPLTDGDLTEADAGVQTVTLTFPLPTPLSAVVVRGAVSHGNGSNISPSAMAVLLMDPDGGVLSFVEQPTPLSLWNGGAPSMVRRPRRDGGVDFELQSDPRYVVIPLDGGMVGSVSVWLLAGGVDRISEVSLFE